jgi:DNA invertase Pin-like site-specific DNA recombinase
MDTAAVETRPAVQTWNVGAYVRLSLVDRKQKGDSIENQQAIIAAYCDERPGLIIREVYIDNGLSGQKLERPAFQKMLSDMENGLIDCCVSKDLSRYGRSAIDTGYYIEKYFPTHGIRCIAINDNYDSADGQSGGVMVNLKNLVNESYALEIGRKIHTTKQMNIRNGCFVGSLPPYGYLKSKEDKHKLVPDPAAAPTVAKIFEMAANGAGVSAIRDWLNDNEILPPMKHLYSVGAASEKMANGNAHWHVNAVYSILKNRVYTGDMVQGKGRTRSYDLTRVDIADWIITENTHAGIVSRELFDEVQALWGKQSKRAKPSTADNIFRRKIFCGHCGYAMRSTRSGKESCVFLCDTRQSHGKDACVPNSIQEATLKRIVLENLRKKAEVYCKDVVIPAKGEAVNEPSELSGVRAELSRISGFLSGLYESLVSGDLTQREYADMKQDYETRIAALTERERILTEAARERHMNQIVVSKTKASLRAVNLITGLTAELIDELVDKILIFRDKRIEIHFKFTDEIAIEGGADNA